MSTENHMEPTYPAVIVDAVFARIADALARRSTPLRVGISGLQGSGKSTLTEQLVGVALAAGHATVAASLDDFYRTRAEREALAIRVHPLLLTRGVPGTHDVALLRSTLAALPSASPANPVAVPRFDKGIDDRADPSRWQQVDTPPALILLEGWCVGVPAQADPELLQAVNALERDEDADGRWRHHVNQSIRDDYEPLWRSLDLLVVLLAPSFDVVVDWRDQQEDALRRIGAPQAMSPDAVARFVAHYERLSRHGLQTLPARAELLLRLDAQRRVTPFTA